MQYKAGYFLNSIFDLFLNQSVKEKVEKIVFQLCHFDLETKDEILHQQVDYISEIKVINNLISRGIPTYPSSFIEDLLATTLGNTKRELSDQNQLTHRFIDDSITEDILKAIHIIDPRVNKTNQFIDIEEKWKLKGAGFKVDFLYSLLPEYLGQAYIQLIEENRDFNSLIYSSRITEINDLLETYESILKYKNDFVLEMPYEINYSKGITIEIDETPSETKYQFEIDQLKKALCKNLSWSEPFVVDTHKLAESNIILRPLMNFTYNEYFDTICKNYRNPVYNSIGGQNALQYTLSPIAVARIQKTIIEYLLSGKLNLDAEIWKIGIIERDVPCAYLAFQDLRLHFENLFALEGKNKKMPELKLSIYRTEEFKNAKLNLIYTGAISSIENFDENEEFDLLLDISMLQRNGIINKEYNTKAKNHAIIKSVRSINAKRKILTDKFIQYQDIFSTNTEEKIKNKSINALKYFLRNLFRKEAFLPGQLELINKSFQQKNCLGLLPSEESKRIAYQLATLLQPGISIVVNPILSVTTDQVVALRETGIDYIANINSSIINPEVFANELLKLENSQCLFLFISPDFLRQKELRETLYSVQQKNLFFNYFIVNEAHCLSEWGHDFRLSYHKLGELKELIIKNNNKQVIPIVATSSTASNACQTDILSELQIEPENIIEVSRQYSNLNFKIIDSTSDQIKPEMSIGQIKQLIGARKQVHFSFLIKEMFPELKEHNKNNNTLIYCPSVYGNSGVSDTHGDGLADKLSNNFEKLKIGSFWGSPDELPDKAVLQDNIQSEKNQIKFINNEFDILITSPSFGIGISKPDIRNIIYFSPPLSIENFIQQTSLAGQDGKEASCAVIIDKQEFTLPENSTLSGFIDTSKTTFDKYLAYEKILEKYKGKEKELTVLRELLSGTQSDKATYIDIIQDIVENEFDIHTELVFQPKNKPARLYINSGDKTFGYVDLSNYRPNIDESNFEPESSLNLVLFITYEIKKRCSTPERCYEILSNELNQSEIDGIESILSKLKTGSIQELVIPYTNNCVTAITEILQKELTESFTKDKIKQFYLSSLSIYDFLEKLYEIKTLDKKNKIYDAIHQLYNQGRFKVETQNAIYRLSKLGFIDDYLIDEINHQFIIKIRKKTNEAHLINLYGMFESFLLPEKASEKKIETEKIAGNYIKKAIDGYIEFCYNYIVKERIGSIETLNDIFLQIIENKNPLNNYNLGIQELFSNYFNAKYTSSFLGLIPGSNGLNEGNHDFSIVESYLTKLGPLKENWAHLKKSTELISKLLPDNPIPYLLDAYTNLVSGEKDEQSIDSAFDLIARGFIKMRKVNGYNPDKYQNNIQSFLDLLYQHRPDLKATYESVLWLRLHYIWLKDFNKKNIENE